MAFRCFQRPCRFKAYRIYLTYLQPDALGVASLVSVDQSEPLPDPSMTDLKACLDAGVDLKDTNCKLLPSTGRIVLPAIDKGVDDNAK